VPSLKKLSGRVTAFQAGVLCVWVPGVLLCVWLWNHYQSPEALAAGPITPENTSWLGRVVYQDDPSLALRIRISRIILLWTAALGLVLAVGARERVWQAIVRLTTMRVHPLNLAVFRIVVFYQIYNIAWFQIISRVGSLPNGLQYPPYTGVPEFLFDGRFTNWPIHTLTADQILFSGTLFKIFCFTGLIGLFSRFSAVAVALLMFIGWGSMQWYGKVDHHHYLLWFCLLFAVSPCGESLSVDSVIRALRGARGSLTESLAPARRYGAPIVFAMLLMGVIYFFPGFWKFWRSGLDWAFSEGPKYTLYAKWHQIGEVVSSIDHYPRFQQIGAFGVLIFELTFCILLFGRRTRYVAAILALSFHFASNVTGRYGFQTLMACYVIFVDWAALFRWVGRRTLPEPMLIAVPTLSATERGFLGVARTCDVFQLIEWADGSDANSQGPGTGKALGLADYVEVAKRIPVYWPLLPVLLGLSKLSVGWPRPRLATLEPSLMQSADAPNNRPLQRSIASRFAVVVVGCLLLAGNIRMGSIREQDGWPFACFPLFDGIKGDSIQTLLVRVTTDAGVERELNPNEYRTTFGNRWIALLTKILNGRDEERKNERLALIWSVMADQDASLSEAATVSFLTVTSRLDPKYWDEPPQDARLIYEMEAPGRPDRATLAN